MKRYIYSALGIAITLIYLHIFYSSQLQMVVWMILGLLALAAIGIFLFGSWYLAERMKMLRASRIELEKQAHVMQLSNGDQTWTRDTDHKATYHALHLEQRVYSNGRYDEPSQLEKETWQTFNTRPTKVIESESEQLALPEPQLDLTTVLNQAERCLIVGVSKSGKTTILQHLAQLKQSTSKVIIIDPHAYPAKWPSNCEVKGVGRDYESINETLNGLVGLMHNRYQDIAKGILTHPQITIIIDEWRLITQNSEDAAPAIKTLLTESRKASFSIFVASHSDRARPLGLQGEYDLKESYTVIRLIYDTYRHLATVDFGDGQKPIILPGPFIEAPKPFSEELIELPKPEPNDTEQAIMKLYRQGKKITPIAVEVFGSKGGNQVNEVKEAIAKWG